VGRLIREGRGRKANGEGLLMGGQLKGVKMAERDKRVEDKGGTIG